MKHLNQWIPVVAALALGTQVDGAVFVGLTTGGNLITFNSASPGTIQTSTSITGLGGQTLLGIDRRPSNGLLSAALVRFAAARSPGFSRWDDRHVER